MNLKELKAKYKISPKDWKELSELIKKEILSSAGKKGGSKNLEKGREYFARISKLAHKAKRLKKVVDKTEK